jgi:aryl-alcohol dehydrogenase-like predicted oxidoreductase
MELRGAPRARDISEAQAETILNAVLDAGINYIDTSMDYGLSEERIGRYIGHRRDEYYLASKCGCLVGAPPAPPGERSPHAPLRPISAANSSLKAIWSSPPAAIASALQ